MNILTFLKVVRDARAAEVRYWRFKERQDLIKLKMFQVAIDKAILDNKFYIPTQHLHEKLEIPPTVLEKEDF